MPAVMYRCPTRQALGSTAGNGPRLRIPAALCRHPVLKSTVRLGTCFRASVAICRCCPTRRVLGSTAGRTSAAMWRCPFPGPTAGIGPASDARRAAARSGGGRPRRRGSGSRLRIRTAMRCCGGPGGLRPRSRGSGLARSYPLRPDRQALGTTPGPEPRPWMPAGMHRCPIRRTHSRVDRRARPCSRTPAAARPGGPTPTARLGPRPGCPSRRCLDPTDPQADCRPRASLRDVRPSAA
ncbi:hypothetical protein EHYA_01021 [Embleya hyalina]|uniref:Uncharacterized protein n=1 Tax=Embleya hyalina TaxID=516124 RepID=A0A401YFM3_9ACTN|nr:hypothetical protein EHYA_01021 [Embleya hyalina]